MFLWLSLLELGPINICSILIVYSIAYYVLSCHFLHYSITMLHPIINIYFIIISCYYYFYLLLLFILLLSLFIFYYTCFDERPSAKTRDGPSYHAPISLKERGDTDHLQKCEHGKNRKAFYYRYLFYHNVFILLLLFLFIISWLKWNKMVHGQICSIYMC